MQTTVITPGPWKILSDPILGEKHTFHETRWITTANADVELSEDMKHWQLSEGQIICQMRDGPRANALLVAAAPDLLAALENIVGLWADSDQTNGLAQIMANDALAALTKAKALSKAESTLSSLQTSPWGGPDRKDQSQEHP